MDNNNQIQLTATIFPDKKANGYIGTIKELPAVLTQGKDVEMVKRNLVTAFMAVINYQLKSIGSTSLDDLDLGDDIITETFNLHLV